MLSTSITYFYLRHDELNDGLYHRACWLGSEQYNGISETILPNYNPNPEGVVVSISKLFESHSCKRWKVLELIRECDSMIVYLEPRHSSSQEEFLSRTHRNNKKVTSKLQFGTLVEVEFGHLNQVYSKKKGFLENQSYPDLIHKGEIHKRRLCVVIKAQAGRVQLVPVTSKAPTSNKDRAIVQISHASLEKLTSYNDGGKQSFVLCQMVKTVSSSRVLPPKSLNPNGRVYRDIGYSCKLSGTDLQNFRNAFSHSVGFQDYYELKDKVGTLFLERKQLTEERDSLSDQLGELEEKYEEISNISSRFEALFEIMIDWHRGTKSCTEEEAREHINAEISYYMSQLGIS